MTDSSVCMWVVSLLSDNHSAPPPALGPWPCQRFVTSSWFMAPRPSGASSSLAPDVFQESPQKCNTPSFHLHNNLLKMQF